LKEIIAIILGFLFGKHFQVLAKFLTVCIMSLLTYLAILEISLSYTESLTQTLIFPLMLILGWGINLSWEIFSIEKDGIYVFRFITWDRVDPYNLELKKLSWGHLLAIYKDRFAPFRYRIWYCYPYSPVDQVILNFNRMKNSPDPN